MAMGLKISRRKVCRFESGPGHQHYETSPSEGAFSFLSWFREWGNFLTSQVTQCFSQCVVGEVGVTPRRLGGLVAKNSPYGVQIHLGC